MKIPYTTSKVFESWYDKATDTNTLRIGSVRFSMSADETMKALKAIAIGTGLDPNDLEAVAFETILLDAMLCFGSREVSPNLLRHVQRFEAAHPAKA